MYPMSDATHDRDTLTATGTENVFCNPIYRPGAADVAEFTLSQMYMAVGSE